MQAKALRKLKSGREYDHLFPKPNFLSIEISKGINVHRTIAHMEDMSKRWQSDTAQLAPLLKGRTLTETCRNIWQFVYDHIQYKLDKSGYEELRRPAYLWAVRATEGGDCDCYAIFISTVLRNLNITHKFRVTKYKADWQHVYIVVPNGKEMIVIDCVLDNFNDEVPFSGNIDTTINMPTVELSGIDEFDGFDLGILKKIFNKNRNRNINKATSNANYEKLVKDFIAGKGQMTQAQFDELRKNAPSVYVRYRAQLDSKFNAKPMSKKEERKLRRFARKDARQTKRGEKAIIKTTLPKSERRNALKNLRAKSKELRKDIKSTKTNPFKKLRERIQEKRMTKKGGSKSEMQQLEDKIKAGTATREDALIIRSKYKPLWRKHKKALQALIASDIKTANDVKQDAIKEKLKTGLDAKQATELEDGDAGDDNSASVETFKPEPQMDDIEEQSLEEMDKQFTPQGQQKIQDSIKKRKAEQKAEQKAQAEAAGEDYEEAETPDASDASEDALEQMTKFTKTQGKKMQKTAANEDNEPEDAIVVDDKAGEGGEGGSMKEMFEKHKTPILIGGGVAALGLVYLLTKGKKKTLSGVKKPKKAYKKGKKNKSKNGTKLK